MCAVVFSTMAIATHHHPSGKQAVFDEFFGASLMYVCVYSYMSLVTMVMTIMSFPIESVLYIGVVVVVAVAARRGVMCFALELRIMLVLLQLPGESTKPKAKNEARSDRGRWPTF